MVSRARQVRRRSGTWPGASTLSRTAAPMMVKAPTASSAPRTASPIPRSEEHTSELQSRLHLVCRLLLEKKKIKLVHQPRLGGRAQQLLTHGAPRTQPAPLEAR